MPPLLISTLCNARSAAVKVFDTAGVSQHIGVLRASGLVSLRADGARRTTWQGIAGSSLALTHDHVDTTSRKSPLMPGVLGCGLPSLSMTWLSKGILTLRPSETSLSPSTSMLASLVPASCQA